ncbi:MAG: hypothetical protein GF411_19690 [Candidatus Lokiarchaeota archaeon]|nr:hypothetical protein [Candidatus Lokiarchaeota archaeon]
MPLSKNELELLACMFDRHIINKRHMPVEAIARFCGGSKKRVKKRLQKLAQKGYIHRVKSSSYSLTMELGVPAARKYLDK